MQSRRRGRRHRARGLQSRSPGEVVDHARARAHQDRRTATRFTAQGLRRSERAHGYRCPCQWTGGGQAPRVRARGVGEAGPRARTSGRLAGRRSGRARHAGVGRRAGGLVAWRARVRLPGVAQTASSATAASAASQARLSIIVGAGGCLWALVTWGDVCGSQGGP